MNAKIVQATFGTGCAISKEYVWIPLSNNIVVEHHHLLVIESNIISVGILNVEFPVVFMFTLRPYNGCFSMNPTNKSSAI